MCVMCTYFNLVFKKRKRNQSSMLHIVCSKFTFTGIRAFFFPPGRKFLFKQFEAKCDLMINL